MNETQEEKATKAQCTVWDTIRVRTLEGEGPATSGPTCSGVEGWKALVELYHLKVGITHTPRTVGATYRRTPIVAVFVVGKIGGCGTTIPPFQWILVAEEKK